MESSLALRTHSGVFLKRKQNLVVVIANFTDKSFGFKKQGLYVIFSKIYKYGQMKPSFGLFMKQNEYFSN